MVITVRGRVHNGRLVVDEPSDLPEGTEVRLVAQEVPAAESAVVAAVRDARPADEALSEQEIRELQQLARGPFVPHEEVRRKLAARKG